MPSATVRLLALGAVSGLRSMSGPAFVSRAARDGRLPLDGSALSFLASPRIATALTVFQAGEMLGDKLPFVPSRTSAGPLLGRAGSGALVGAALSSSEGRRLAAGAALGAGAALVGAFAGEKLRGLAAQQTGLPDVVFAIAEDAVVLLAGRAALR